jgi:truncated hemoglobin YjbI
MESLFEKCGGKPALERIIKKFYDKVYAHPWLGYYFKNIKQSIIESQQVDFMIGALGGPRVFFGKMPGDAHPHLMVTNELFDLRQKLMLEALKEEGAAPELIDRWLKVEGAFKEQIVKKDISECQKRFYDDEILDFPKKNAA